MGHRFEEVADASVRNLGKDEKKENPKLRTSAHSDKGSDEQNDPQGNEVFQLVMLLERSESSEALKSLLLSIINSDRCEELIPFLKERPTDSHRLKKKKPKANSDERPRRQSGRRSSKTGGRSDLADQGTGSGQRKSTRIRLSEQGSRVNTQGISARLNNVPISPGTSLRRSRQSDSCLRKGLRDSAVESQNQRSRLASSSSLLQFRANRRIGDSNRRRSMMNFNEGETQADNANESWDPVPGPLTNNKFRSNIGDLLKSPNVSPGNQNHNWDSALSPRGVAGIDKPSKKTLRKTFDESFNLSDINNDSGDNSDVEEKTSQGMKNSKLMNSFAQFEPTGQVAYMEQTVLLNDLVDDLRSNRDLNNESRREDISSNIEANDESMPQKKGLRKYLTRQLTKKIVGSRDKQSIAAESTNESYKSISDEDKFAMNDLHDSYTSNSLQRSIAS